MSLCIVVVILHADCPAVHSVDDFKRDMEEALHDPRRYILAWAPHERTLRTLEDTKMRARTRERGRELKEDADLTPDTRIFKDKLDAVGLKCWPYVPSFERLQCLSDRVSLAEFQTVPRYSYAVV